MAYSTISKPSLHFNTKLYTGNGGTQSITGVGFQPDWVWLKKRNSTADHGLYDAVRGVTKQLYSNDAAAEATNANSLTAFGTDGFSIGTSSMINGNSDTFASWNWKANGAGSANTDGSINSTVSVNTTAGFSIVKWTGNATTNQTVGHGLGAVPKVIITKNTNNASQPWKCYFSEVGNDKYLILNTTDAPSTSGFLYNTTPTNSLFTISNDTGMNGSGNSIIAYCFAEKKGYSKFGSYTGNGSTNGTFVYTGFKPAFVLWKRTEDAGYDWDMYDTARDTHNVAFKEIMPNSNAAESSSTVLSLDILSNGFKLRTTNANGNGSGKPYIYMAFAEEPLVANVGAAIPATAR